MLSKSAHNGRSIYRQCQFVCLKCQVGRAATDTSELARPRFTQPTRHFTSVPSLKASESSKSIQKEKTASDTSKTSSKAKSIKAGSSKSVSKSTSKDDGKVDGKVDAGGKPKRIRTRKLKASATSKVSTNATDVDKGASQRVSKSITKDDGKVDAGGKPKRSRKRAKASATSKASRRVAAVDEEAPQRVSKGTSKNGAKATNDEKPAGSSNMEKTPQRPQVRITKRRSKLLKKVPGALRVKAKAVAVSASRRKKTQTRRRLRTESGRNIEDMDGHESLEAVLLGSSTQNDVSGHERLTPAQERREALRRVKQLTAEEEEIKAAKELNIDDIKLDALQEDMPPVPRLAHGLHRALFNRGVYQFRDLHSRVYNFDPALELIPPIKDIDFDSLKGFTPSSEDKTLSRIATQNSKRYTGSTSSMTGILKHLHFLLSKFRPVNMDMLSTQVREALPPTFTKITAAPEAIFLKWNDGTYAIDADKEFGFSNVLSFMGRYMEKLLTVDMESFERYKKGQPNPITDEELRRDESYHYSSIGNILMRSQLDAYDPRLPGTGMFDLKTRAVIPIRMESSNLEPPVGYELKDTLGVWESYEREYADMIRSTLLKYSLQARMGRMDGIFVAYHNITRMFGFQYLSLNEMDLALHGQSDRTLGDSEFLYSVHLLNQILDRATERYPEQSLRVFFETKQPRIRTPFNMDIFVEPVTEEKMVRIQTANQAQIEEWERSFFSSGPAATDAATDSTTDAATDAGALEADAELAAPLSTETEAAPETAILETETDDDADPDAVVDPEDDLETAILEPDTEDADPESVIHPGENLDTDIMEPETNDDADPDAVVDPGNDPETATLEHEIDDDADLADDLENAVSIEPTSATATTTPGTPEGKPAEEDEINLLHLRLRVFNKQNGTRIFRPSQLTSASDWTLRYHLVEEATGNDASAAYLACKRRRKALLELAGKAGGGDEANGVAAPAKSDFFMRQLREYVNKGTEWRERIDALDAEEERKRGGVLVWDREDPVSREEFALRGQGGSQE